MAFFQKADAFGFLIDGHTDSIASDEYNINLSNRRANMVAGIAQDAGTRVVDVRCFGEQCPTATNATSAGRAENRRVKIYCIC
jgi:outer membrane protein OmpA-like peptidoglycan-associated protein